MPVVNIAIYLRQSTTHQDSLAQQKVMLDALVNAHPDWVVKGVYEDQRSGKDFNRPGFQALMDSLGRDHIRIIVCTKIDRLVRSLTNLLNLVNELQERRISIWTLDMGQISFDTPQGKLLTSILGSLAEWEREMISSRTKDSLAVKKAQGVVLGRPQTGVTKEQIVELHDQGKTYQQIAVELHIGRTTIYRILSS